MEGRIEALKSKWEDTAREVFNEAIGSAQKSFKKMLAVEELGFLKESGENRHKKPTVGTSTKLSTAGSNASILTASSSYEKVNDADIDVEELPNVPEENDRDL